MAQPKAYRFTHTDIELMRLRVKLTPGQRLQAMLDARELAAGLIRGRLSQQDPELSSREINLKLLEEIERDGDVSSRSFSLPGHFTET